MALIRLNNQSLTAVTSAGLPSGTVLQVVSISNTGIVSTTSSSFVTSGVSLSITPTSSSNKIMMISSGATQNTAVSGGGVQIAVYRGGSQLYDAGLQHFTAAGGNSISGFCVQYLDSPATTSSVTYAPYFLAYSTGTAYAKDIQIALMEIAG